VINAVSLAGGNIVFSGTNGYPSAPFTVLTSTNLASPNWTVVATGSFNGTGAFSVTNAITPGTPQAFYRLQQ
jgi:hypothetical protein